MEDASSYDEYARIADLYDHVWPYRERPDVGFLVEEASKTGGPVLELGCGTGRVLIPTARVGIEIVGVDLSPHMLGVCREHLRNEPRDVQSRVRLVEADMRGFDLGRTFALVTIPFRPFQHLLTVRDQLACLERVRAHLADEGTFIFDVFNPSLDALANRQPGEEFGEEPPFTMPDGRRVTRRARLVGHDRFSQVQTIEIFYDITHADDRQERLVHAFAMRYLFRFEVEHLLTRAGFAVQHLYGGFDKSGFGSTYPGELVFVARKAAA